jgi:RES domain-containing protein
LRFRGILYRALNPIWASQPLSGEGARLFGGRFNPKGVPAIYASLSVQTALREVNQVGSLQPTTLVSYEADLQPMFDSRDTISLAEFGAEPELLAEPSWREQMAQGELASTQRLAVQLLDAGFAGMIVRSFAAGATDNGLNAVVWKWSSSTPNKLVLIDDEGRLSAS